MKKYIPVENPDINANYLRVELYYYLGGYNLFTYKQEPRGYYLSISPVHRTARGGYVTESYTAFTGIKKCIKTVTRKSAKAETEATRDALELLPDFIDYVCRHNGYTVNAEEVIF